MPRIPVSTSLAQTAAIVAQHGQPTPPAGASILAGANVPTSGGARQHPLLPEPLRTLWRYRGETGLARYFVGNVTKPWLLPMAMRLLDDANAATKVAYRQVRVDDGSDAFRHAYTGALMAQRLMSKHGVSAGEAHRLTRDAGDAHEANAWGPSPHRELAQVMDRHNNELGMSLVPAPDGRVPTEPELAKLVLDSIGGGEAIVFGTSGHLRGSTATDLPALVGVPAT